MAKFPSLPLFVDAYVADTMHLTDAEHGRYLLMMMHMWIAPECRFPNDDKWLARKFRRTIEEVQRELRPIITEFMQTDGNWITQKRLAKERKFVTQAHEKRSVAAKTRWDKEKTTHNAYAPTPTPIKKDKNLLSSSVTTSERIQPSQELLKIERKKRPTPGSLATALFDSALARPAYCHVDWDKHPGYGAEGFGLGPGGTRQ